MVKKLEQSDAVEEQSIEEIPKIEEEPSVKTYTEEDVNKRLAGVQSAKNGELAKVRQELDKIQAEKEASSQRLQSLESDLNTRQNRIYTLEDQIAEASDDPAQAKSAIQLRREVQAEKVNLEKEKDQLKQEKTEVYIYARKKRAEELNKEYGIPLDDVLTAPTEDGMVNKALMFALGKSKEAKVEPEIETPQPDGAVSTAGASSFEKIQQKFIAGDVSLEKYEEEARKAGKNL